MSKDLRAVGNRHGIILIIVLYKLFFLRKGLIFLKTNTIFGFHIKVTFSVELLRAKNFKFASYL